MPPWLEMVITVFVSMLASGGLWGFIQYRFQRNDEVQDTLKQVTDSIKKLDEKVDENNARSIRRNILRFSDELQNNIWHSKDNFRQIKEDAKHYEAYCRDHPDFPNGFTESAIEYIDTEYQRLLEKHAFAKPKRENKEEE